MKLQINATEKEIQSPELIKAIASALGKVRPVDSDELYKAVVKKDVLLTEPVLLEIQKQWEMSYKEHMENMIDDISQFFDKAITVKRIPVK